CWPMKRDRIHLIQTGIRRICGVLASHPPPRLMRNIEEVGELPIQATNSSVRRPSLATVEDSDDFETLATHSIRCPVSCPRNHELARPRHPARPSEIREVCETLDGGEHHRANTCRCAGVLPGDVSTKFSKVTDRA